MLNAIGKGNYESEEAWQFVADLFANTVVIDSSSSVWKGVRDGEYTVGLSYEDPSATLVRDGADVEVSTWKKAWSSARWLWHRMPKLPQRAAFYRHDHLRRDPECFRPTMTNRPVIANVETLDYMTPLKE